MKTTSSSMKPGRASQSRPSHLLPSTREFGCQSKVKLSQNRLSSCCDMGQNDTIGKIELNPSIVLSSDNTNCKNDIQLFHQLFDELSVYRDYH